MNRMLTRVNKSLSGNKGFSLIELVIVIAIMAALIAILAPQYLKYVEKSRITADQTGLDELMTSVNVALADSDTSWKAGTITTSVAAATGVMTITWTGANGTGTPTLQTVVTNSFGSDSVILKSKTGKALAATLSIVVAADGTATWTGFPTTW